jgi:hypothetical protein
MSWVANGSGSSTLTVGSTPTSGGAAGQIMFDTGSVLSESSNHTFNSTTRLFTNAGPVTFSAGTSNSYAAWGTNGINLIQSAATFTDTSTAASGTVTTAYMNVFGAQTYAATNTAVTVSTLYGTYFINPVAGTNVTAPTKYALGADSFFASSIQSVTANIANSASSHTDGYSAGTTTSGNTKTVNIGVNGLSGSTTVINIGATASTSTTTLNGTNSFPGTSSAFAMSIANANETVNVVSSAPTATTNFYLNNGAVQYYTTSNANNWTLNVAFSSGTSLNTALAIGQSVTFTMLATNGATAYYNSAVTIDGTAVTPKWQGGTAPSAGNASSVDVYNYTIIKTASATYTVLASLTQFK